MPFLIFNTKPCPCNEQFPLLRSQIDLRVPNDTMDPFWWLTAKVALETWHYDTMRAYLCQSHFEDTKICQLRNIINESINKITDCGYLDLRQKDKERKIKTVTKVKLSRRFPNGTVPITQFSSIQAVGNGSQKCWHTVWVDLLSGF